MEITPNFTIVIQIVHFGLAYAGVRILLCKPVIEILYQEQANITALRTSIADKSLLIDATKDNLYKQLYAAHSFFIQNRPLIRTGQTGISGAKTEVQTDTHLDDTHVDAMVDRLVHGIVSQVLYDTK